MNKEEALKTIEELKNYISLEMIDNNKPKELTDLFAKSMVAFQVMKNEYNKEKEKNKNLEKDKKYKDRIIKGLGLNTIPRTITSFNEMIDKYYINKDKIRDLIVERQFELQQEFKDFKDDIRLNTLQEIYYLE